jgi:hypothetical protein
MHARNLNRRLRNFGVASAITGNNNPGAGG